jgi:trigger factor
MAVQVQQEQIDHCRVALTIEVPPDDVRKAMDSVYNQVAKRTAIPGFRPGKAPRHLLKRFIDEQRVKEMAFDRVLNDAFRDALKQTGVTPYSQVEPDVELPDDELDPETGFSFKATVALPPHVHLGELEGLTARRVVTPIRDEDITREIDRYREAGGTFEPTSEAAQDGDRVRLTLTVTVDGEEVPDASLTEPTLLQIGSNLEEFDAALLGITAGEDKEFDFSYPGDYDDEALAGKSAHAKVHATEVLRRAIPALDDEFAQRVGFESVEDLQNRVRELLQGQADAMTDQELNDTLIDEVIRRSTVHFPPELVEQEVSARLSDLIKALERRSLTLDSYLASQEKTLAELQDQMRADAQSALTFQLVLMEIARENAITVSQEDIDGAIKERAENEKVKFGQMRRLLTETGELANIQHRLFVKAVLAFLREKADIHEVTA